jgi:predicted component of type VI protein secretion system
VIRIKSSQVSRRHCELFDVDGKLTVRDMGSSNGTYINGKRIAGQHPLKVGDELTVGAITLRVATLGQPIAAPHAGPTGKPGDTAVVEALPLDDEEFEIEFDEGDPATKIEVIPLAESEPAPTNLAATSDGNRKPVPPPPPAAPRPAPQPASKPKQEDEAVAQFLLDLDIDED